jgi:Protein of unknown function (DUF3060)
MRLIVTSVLSLMLSLPALAQVNIGKDGSVTVKDGKDTVKVDNKGVSTTSPSGTTAVTGAGVVTDKGGAHDCATTPEATVNGNKVTLMVTGACTKITVNGNENSVTAEKATEIVVNGNKNKVTVKELLGGTVNGKDNEVVWTTTGKADQAQPAVKVKGKKNVVKSSDAAAAGAATDASKKATADVSKDAKKEEKKADKEVKDALGGLGIK